MVRRPLHDASGRGRVSAVTLVTEHARALEMFERFLAFSRESSAPAMASPAPEPSLHAHPPVAEVITSVTPWEEPTRERPDVMRAMVAGSAAHPDTSPGMTSPEIRAPLVEQSIIVDDDTLTDPEFGKALLHQMSDLLRPAAPSPSAPMPVEQLVQEMSVLVKYGHSAQAAEETERWIRAHPDDVSAHLELAEYELQRLDREAAIQRFLQLLSRLVERGDARSARDVVRRMRGDIRGDARVDALVTRLNVS